MAKLHIKPKSITLRPIGKSDEPFLRKAYETSRDDELKDVVWNNPAERESFFRMQFDAQSLHYETFFGTADFDIIEVEGKPAGRLIVSWNDDHAVFIDIILVPKYRKLGIAGSIMDALIKEVDRRGISASLSYEKWKPYLEKVYARYGFVTVNERPGHFVMERPKKTK